MDLTPATALLREQEGVIARRQALRLGLTDPDLARHEEAWIEATLTEHPAVRAAGVVVRTDGPGGGPRLVAYVVGPHPPAPSPASPPSLPGRGGGG